MHNKVSHLYQKAAFDYLLRLDQTPGDSYAPDYVFYVRYIFNQLLIQMNLTNFSIDQHTLLHRDIHGHNGQGTLHQTGKLLIE